MDTQTNAQIYLSGQRGCSQRDSSLSFHSFNYGSYFDESRKPFGGLQLVNDTRLNAGYNLLMSVNSNTDAVIIPLVGGLEYTSPLGNGFLVAGQAQVFSLGGGMSYEIINPYEQEFISFLELWLTSDTRPFSSALHPSTFDINDTDRLHPVFFSGKSSYVYIGQYNARIDGVYHLSQAGAGIFVFVLSGVFEVQNRLLHERDGLSLQTIKNSLVEFEALCNNAVLLIIEIPVLTQRD